MATALALVYAGYQIRITRQLATQARAHQYFERWSEYTRDPAYKVAKAFALQSPGDTPGERAQRVNELRAAWRRMSTSARANDQERVEQIYFVLNFFEELGGLYLDGLVDRRITRDYLGAFASMFWDGLSWWWIAEVRDERGDPKILVKLEAMRSDISDADAREARFSTGTRSRTQRQVPT